MSVARRHGVTENDVYKGTVKGFNASADKLCAAWNTDTKHLAKHVDPTTGKCLFKHGVCNQFVTDKGPGGICGGNHRRKDCDHDADKKCKKPVA